MVDSYPEYLNPFAEDLKPKTKLTIRSSFKEFKRSFRQSFRIKKKPEEDVTIREKPVGTFQRNPISYPCPQPEALPRSRFRERLSLSPKIHGSNPFEEQENGGEVKSTIRRRGKKRAPLPPKSKSSQFINDDQSEISAGGSHWSLTSVDTDYSGSVYDIVSEQDESVKRSSIVDKFIVFNQEMDALNDDTNNNVVTKDEIRHNTDSSNNIPDLVVSCPSENPNGTPEPDDSERKEVEECTIERKDHNEDEAPKECTLEIKKDKEESIPHENVDNEGKIEETENNNEEEKCSKPKEEETENNNEEINEEEKCLKPEEEEEKKSIISGEDETELIVKDITNNLIKEDNKVNEAQLEVKTEEELFLYHEKKSLYIAGSRDELNDSNNYTGRVSLYITGSCDDLDASNNNEVCNKTDENSNHDAVPTPKQRKNKLSKNILLGM